MTRFLLYSHDSYGLGHFRRTSLLAAGIAAASTQHEVLIVTGSPRAQSFRLPDRVDTVKLPTATKGDNGNYRPRKLACGIEQLVGVRSALISAAVRAFAPDVILVDHAPLGMANELSDALTAASAMASRPRIVLGLRDIIDDADRVRAAWDKDGIWDALDLYDDILVYGDKSIVTTAEELDLAFGCNVPVTYTGYVAPTMPAAVEQDPYLLITAGGGGDGQTLFRRYLDVVEVGATSDIRSVVVTGPLLSSERTTELTTRAAGLSGVDLLEFTPDMRALVSSATGVVSMAGYNTVVEELAAQRPALLVPRRAPRQEQHIRATRLASVTPMQTTPPEAMTPELVADFVSYCQDEARARLDTPDERFAGIDLRGIDGAVAALTDSEPELLETTSA